jgi:hypothetical protein
VVEPGVVGEELRVGPFGRGDVLRGALVRQGENRVVVAAKIGALPLELARDAVDANDASGDAVVRAVRVRAEVRGWEERRPVDVPGVGIDHR